MSDVLLQADAIAGQDRSRDYGHPHPNHERIAWFWNAYFQSKGYDARVSAQDVPLMMILLKIARHVHTQKFDNLIDMAGYVKCQAMIENCESARRNGLNGPPMSTPFDDVPQSKPVAPWPCGNCNRVCDHEKQFNRFGVPVCDQCWNESIKPVKATE